jgi:hypothetical protein
MAGAAEPRYVATTITTRRHALIHDLRTKIGQPHPAHDPATTMTMRALGIRDDARLLLESAHASPASALLRAAW